MGTTTRPGAGVVLTGGAVVRGVGGIVVGLVVGLGVLVVGGGEAVVVVLVVLVLGCGFTVVLRAATTTGSDVMEL